MVQRLVAGRRLALLLVAIISLALHGACRDGAATAEPILRFLPSDPPLDTLRARWITDGAVTLRALDDGACHALWPVANVPPAGGPAALATLSTSSRDDRVSLDIEGLDGVPAPQLLEVHLRSRDSDSSRTGSLRLFWRGFAERFAGDRSLVEEHGAVDEGGVRSYRFELGRHSGWRREIAGLRLVLLPPSEDLVELCSIVGRELAFDPDAFADAVRDGIKAEVGGQIRNALPGWNDFPITREVDVPAAGELRFGYAVLEGSPGPVELEVFVEAGGQSQRRFGAVLGPRTTAGRWHDARVSLADLAGQSVTIRLVTRAPPGAEPWHGTSFWGHPEVLALPRGGRGSLESGR